MSSASPPWHRRFPAGLTVFGREFLPVPVILQGIEAFIHFKDHIAAPAAVAAVRTAVGDIEFPAEADMAVAALAGTDKYLCSVCKHPYVSFL